MSLTSAAGAEPSPAPVAGPRPAYAFHVNLSGMILDENGAAVSALDVPALIQSLHLAPGTAMVLLIDGPEAIKNASPTIKAFGEQFTTIIVKQWDPKDTLGRFMLPASTVVPLKAAIPAAYPGKSFPPIADPAAVQAVLAERPADFQPGTVPPRIRYQYVDNTVNNRAVRQLRNYLEAKNASSGIFWNQNVVIQVGAWKFLEDEPALKVDKANVFHMAVPTDEMKQWWPFIDHDITEPILIWETADQRHRFLFGFTRTGVGMLDDLSELSDLSAP